MERIDEVAYNYAKDNATLGLDYDQVYDGVKHGYEEGVKDSIREAVQLLEYANAGVLYIDYFKKKMNEVMKIPKDRI